MGAECEDDGTYVRSAFSVMKRLGVAAERLWPYDPRNVNVRRTIVAMQDAYDHRIDAYYRIIARGAAKGAEVRAAIDAGLPVVFGVDVGRDFLNYTGGEGVIFEQPATSVGGHATVIVGYCRLADGSYAYLVRNSWGTSWGLRSVPGHCWISDRYLAFATDLWVPTKSLAA